MKRVIPSILAMLVLGTADSCFAEGGGALVWDVAAEFGVTNGNPNGSWAYGRMDVAFSSFIPQATGDYSSSGVNPIWYTTNSAPLYGSLWKNLTASTIEGVKPGELALHPCQNYAPCVVRWTAPTNVSGSATIAGRFSPGNSGRMTVAVRFKGTEVWRAVDAGAFCFTTNIVPGDTVDFAVFGGYTSGATPLDARIIMSPRIIVATAGANGSITPAGAVPMVEGASTNFTIQAAPGHHIAEVLVDGVSVGPFGPGSNTFSYAFSLVSTSHTIRATFNTPPVIRVTAAPSYGVAPLHVLYDFTTSTDTEMNIVRYEVDREGDGLFETVSEGNGRVVVQYGAPAHYMSVVRITDACGATATSALPITVWSDTPRGEGTSVVWDVVAEFAVTNGNPNGVWSYGWMDTAFSNFTLEVTGDYSSSGVNPIWYTTNNAPVYGSLWKNLTASLIEGVKPGELAIHPCQNTGPCVARWTAPPYVFGAVSVTGRFSAGNSGKMTVDVRFKGKEVWRALDAGAFNFTTNVSPGDTVDFAVFGGYQSGATPLGARITMLPHVIVATAGPNGSIVPAGAIPLARGGGTDFIVQAAPGHHIAEILVDGVSAGRFGSGSNTFSYSFSQVTTSHTIRATFNTAPSIAVTASPTNGVAPLRVLYDFTGSADTETNIVRCEVDKEGDGLYETACERLGCVIIEYGAPGWYLTSARVIDAFGASSSVSIPISVWGRAPNAVLQAIPASNTAPFVATFIGTNSASALGHQIVVYEWDFDGDGEYDVVSRTGMVTHVYREPGVFEASVRITDDQGLQDKASVLITAMPPVITPPSVTLHAIPESGTIPLSVAFTVEASGVRPIVEYRWDFDGDGSVDLRTSGDQVLHTYGEVGVYQASVTAVDSAGLSSGDATTISAREASSLRVWIVSPNAGDRVSGDAITINVNAAPVSQLAAVQVRCRVQGAVWQNVGDLMVPPPADFRTTWSVTSLEEGAPCELQAIALDRYGFMQTSAVVAVTVDNSGAKQPGKVTEGDLEGTHTRQETCDMDAKATIQVYDGTSVIVPFGAVDSNVTVGIELTGPNTNPDTGAAFGQANINANRKVSLDGDPDLNKPVTITLPYADGDNDGIIDGTSISETTLSAYWYDTADGKWKKPLSCEIDTLADLVRITTYHLTEFALYGNQNLLLPANGGVLKSCSFGGTNAVAAANLADGNFASYWMAPTNSAAQEFVYAFTNYQGAICAKAVVYNYGDAGQGLSNYSRSYSIHVALDLEGSNFVSVTNGILPMSESPVAIDMGSVTCRTVKLVLSGGNGPQFGLAEFELHGRTTSDPNGNSMNDAWEMRYFGSLARTGRDDYDGDNLDDMSEFYFGTDPTKADSDGDGMADGWEVRYGLLVNADDAAGDTDGDGMSNGQEFIAGSDPTDSGSVFRIEAPLGIGTWSRNIIWDGTNAIWRTGTSFRVEGLVFAWATISGRVYRLSSTTNLLFPWAPVSPDFEGGRNAIYTNWFSNSVQRFYRLEVDDLP